MYSFFMVVQHDRNRKRCHRQEAGYDTDMIQKKNVKLVTHTGCDMSLTEAEELGIEMIPDKVIFEDQEYRNMVDITADEFYEKLQAADTLPTSSQPSNT